VPEIMLSLPEALEKAFNAYNTKKYSEVERLCTAILVAYGEFFDALHLLALAQSELGRSSAALDSYDRALAVRPDDAEALYNRGNTLQELGRFKEAVENYERALAVGADFAEVLNNRGVAVQKLGRFKDALESYEKALAVRPDYAEALNNCGNALQEVGRFEEALARYEQALAIKPEYAEALDNRGNTLRALGRLDEAIECHKQALAVRPDFAEAFYNRGNTLRDLKRFDEAMESFQRALALKPHFALCQVNRAYLLLLTGKFSDGWQAYEWRREEDSWIGRSLSGPQWRKGEVRPERLLLYAEQGLGDTIQFSRFASSLAAGGKEVFLEVQSPLGGLLGSLKGVNVVRYGETLPEHDAHFPLMSLPHVLGVTPETLSSNFPYLFAEPARMEAWAKRLPAGQFRVGIVWQGKPTGVVDNGRSIPLGCFAPLCRIPGLRLISLQKNDGIEQLADLPSGMRVETLGAEFDPGPDAFLDTAAVMMNLDLVISSDTAAAHLAGALGCPLWIALRHVPDWRWMIDREDTPWYPTARLFRQTRRGDWDELFERIAGELARAATAKTQGETLISRRTR
jgi:tetratricopeptide (TPR) repeat protein